MGTDRFLRVAPAHPARHNSRMTKTITSLLFILAAAVTAKWLADLAHDDLGLSRQVIRDNALLMAAGLGGFVVMVLFSDRFGGKR